MKKIIILGLFLTLVLTGCNLPFLNKTVLKPEEATAHATDFINKYLVEPGSSVTIKDVAEENGLYKLKVVFTNGQEYDSYLSKDGKLFFIQAIKVDELKEPTPPAPAPAIPTEPTPSEPTSPTPTSSEPVSDSEQP